MRRQREEILGAEVGQLVESDGPAKKAVWVEGIGKLVALSYSREELSGAPTIVVNRTVGDLQFTSNNCTGTPFVVTDNMVVDDNWIVVHDGAGAFVATSIKAKPHVSNSLLTPDGVCVPLVQDLTGIDNDSHTAWYLAPTVLPFAFSVPGPFVVEPIP